jgi:hypothetical protein
MLFLPKPPRTTWRSAMDHSLRNTDLRVRKSYQADLCSGNGTGLHSGDTRLESRLDYYFSWLIFIVVSFIFSRRLLVTILYSLTIHDCIHCSSRFLSLDMPNIQKCCAVNQWRILQRRPSFLFTGQLVIITATFQPVSRLLSFRRQVRLMRLPFCLSVCPSVRPSVRPSVYQCTIL